MIAKCQLLIPVTKMRSSSTPRNFADVYWTRTETWWRKKLITSTTKVMRKLGDRSDISDCLPRSAHSASAQWLSAVGRGWLGKVSQQRTIAIALEWKYYDFLPRSCAAKDRYISVPLFPIFVWLRQTARLKQNW